jgi:endonuclease-8
VPEGDTIHRVADRLRPALVGATLVRIEAPRAVGRRPAPGTVVAAVDAVGKHLLIRFADGVVLRTHLRMTGSWHLYRTGERWQKGAHLVRALVEVPGWVAVCFSAPIVALEHDHAAPGPRGRGVARPPAIDHLGPDLTRADVDDAAIDGCLDRMARLSGAGDEIGAVLLDQRVACGVGNVFKSEVLWACGVDPATRVADLDLGTRRHLLTTAARQLRANVVSSGPRVTYEGGYAVYGRRGQPCRRCGTPVRMRRQGEQARCTYWCPTCQPPPATTPAPTEETLQP